MLLGGILPEATPGLEDGAGRPAPCGKNSCGLYPAAGPAVRRDRRL